MYFDGELFKQIKKQRKLTNIKLADMLGVTKNTISRWANGETKPQRLDILAICEILHIEPERISNIKKDKYTEALDKIKEEHLLASNTSELHELVRSKSLNQKQAAAIMNLTRSLESYKNIHKRYKYLINSYEEILNNVEQIIYVKDQMHRYKYVNEPFISITGPNIFRDDITSISYSKIFEKSDYYELLKLEKEVFRTGISVKDVKIIIPNTNGTRMGLVNIIPRLNPTDQSVSEIVVTIQDSTQIFYALEKQEQLTDVINNLNEYVFIRTVSSVIQNNKYIFLSEAVKNIYGYSPEDFYEDPDLWKNLILKEDFINLKIDKNSKYLSPGTQIYRIINKNGKIRWLQNNVSKKYGLDGREILFGNVSDITEKYIIQKEREELERVVELSGIVMWVGDTNLATSPADPLPLTYVSNNTYEHLGVTKTELLEDSRKWFDSIYSNDKTKVLKFIYLEKYPKNMDFRIVSKDNTIQWINLKIDRKDNWIYGIVRDFTDAKEADLKRLELQKAVENSDSLVLVEVLKSINNLKAFEFAYIGSKIKERWGITKKQLLDNPNIWLDLIIPEDKCNVIKTLNSKKTTITLKYRIIDNETNKPKWLYHKIVRRQHARYSYIAPLWYKELVETYELESALDGYIKNKDLPSR